MKACSACGCHVRGEGACPHCGARAVGVRAAAAVLLGLAAVGCNGGPVQALYGDAVVITDEDGDGWALEDDCDDTDADVYPDAEETPGDGVDSNCDGQDDT